MGRQKSTMRIKKQGLSPTAIRHVCKGLLLIHDAGLHLSQVNYHKAEAQFTEHFKKLYECVDWIEKDLTRLVDGL